MPDVQAEQLKKARQGDMDAFAEVFEAFRPLMNQVAYRLVGADDYEDVVMDSFLKVWRALPNFRGDAKLKTWLCKIVRNCSLDHLRKNKKTINFSPGVDDNEDPVQKLPAPESATPDQQAHVKDLNQQLSLALAQLSDNHRTVLLLHEVDGLAYREIAASTGVSIGTVMSRLFHARRQMRRILKLAEVTP